MGRYFWYSYLITKISSMVDNISIEVPIIVEETIPRTVEDNEITTEDNGIVIFFLGSVRGESNPPLQ